MPEIQDLIMQTAQSTRSEREKLEAKVTHVESVMADLESAIVECSSWLEPAPETGYYNTEQGYTSPQCKALAKAYATLTTAKSVLADLDNVDTLLQQVVSSPRQVAEEVLNRLSVHIQTVPQTTAAVRQAQLDAVEAWGELSPEGFRPVVDQYINHIEKHVKHLNVITEGLE